MLSGYVADTINSFTQHVLLSDSELGAVFPNTELPGLYMDPVLPNDPSKYAEFVAQIFRYHLVWFDFVALSHVALFCLTKKPEDGKVRQRLVIDARRSNRLFGKPVWCPLSSGEGLLGWKSTVCVSRLKRTSRISCIA